MKNVGYYLQVDVNGQETFFVDKEIMAEFSGRLSKLTSEMRSQECSIRVIFHDFPGGAKAFELIAKFCYNRGQINLIPDNILLLHSASKFLEMDQVLGNGVLDLVKQTSSYMERTDGLKWSDLVHILKQFQELESFMDSSDMFRDFLDGLVKRIAMPYQSSLYESSSDDSSVEFSGDLSINSSGKCSAQANWWFKDLEFMSIDMLEKLVRRLILHKLDHEGISCFLFYYQKSKFLVPEQAEKCRIFDTVVNLLCLLDGNFISSRGLFDLLRVSITLKLSKCCMRKLENLAGSQLDQSTADDLLFPSPNRKTNAYDVEMILRLLKVFLTESSKQFYAYRMKKVANLIDFYIMEVSPDPWLSPSKFEALATVLPDIARDSYDKVYEAMDTYFKVHYSLSEEQMMKLCYVLDFDKLSRATLIHISSNPRFPPCARKTASSKLQAKLGQVFKEKTNLMKFKDQSSCDKHKGYSVEIVLQTKEKQQKASRKSKRNGRKIQTTVETNCRPLPRLCRN